jgi:hypothetical protein
MLRHAPALKMLFSLTPWALLVALAGPVAGAERALGGPGEFGALAAPFSFEAQSGPGADPVRFISSGSAASPGFPGARGRLLLLPAEAVLHPGAGRKPLRLRFGGGDPDARITGSGELPGRVHYLIGPDPGRWRRDVRRFAAVRYEDLYPGIDLVFHGERGALEFDFIVEPGADPEPIRIEIDPSYASLDAAGDLVVALEGAGGGVRAGAEVRLRAPVIYQEAAASGGEGARRARVEGSFLLGPGGIVRFRIGPYDRERPLVIDPMFDYSTYLGGRKRDSAVAIRVDASGSAYIAGLTSSANIPQRDPFQEDRGNRDSFVAKLDPSGSTLVYGTYLGGSEEDEPTDMAVDQAGSVYVIGSTNSRDFPTRNAFQGSRRGERDAFVARLDPSGSDVIYATYLGGSDFDSGNAIAIDLAGSAYVTGSTFSKNFPLVNPFQDRRRDEEDSFVAKIDPTGAALVYSTFLGGNGRDSGLAIAVAADGGACVTGTTGSNNFPVLNPIEDRRQGNFDAFVTRFNPAGTALVFSTYLGGGESDTPVELVLDAAGNVVLAGTTRSKKFPTTPGAFQEKKKGGEDIFVTRLDPSGTTILYSTFLGGRGSDTAGGMALDGAGNIYIAGTTRSGGFPRVDAIQRDLRAFDAFVTRINAAGDTLDYSTFVGGRGVDRATSIAVDAAENAYITGNTRSDDYPIANALQPELASREGEEDFFITKISPLFAIDTATVKVQAPTAVNLSARTPAATRRIKVTIQNRSLLDEVIPDASALLRLVSLEVQSLGACPDVPAALIPPASGFPIVLSSKKKLKLTFEAVFDCANDPAASSSRDPGHDDYTVVVTVDHAAFDGRADTHPEDDDCPHDALPGNAEPNPDGSLKDAGCGRRKADGTFGAPILIDVRVR